MINTMRLKQLYTILLLCCVNICFAQNKLFDKYADMDDVTCIYLQKDVSDDAGHGNRRTQPCQPERENRIPANTHHPKKRI